MNLIPLILQGCHYAHRRHLFLVEIAKSLKLGLFWTMHLNNLISEKLCKRLGIKPSTKHIHVSGIGSGRGITTTKFIQVQIASKMLLKSWPPGAIITSYKIHQQVVLNILQQEIFVQVTPTNLEKGLIVQTFM